MKEFVDSNLIRRIKQLKESGSSELDIFNVVSIEMPIESLSLVRLLALESFMEALLSLKPEHSVIRLRAGHYYKGNLIKVSDQEIDDFVNKAVTQMQLDFEIEIFTLGYFKSLRQIIHLYLLKKKAQELD